MANWLVRWTAVGVFSLFLSSLASAAIYPPDLDWRRLNSQHLEIIFAEDNRELAEAYAAAGERAFSLLETLFGEAPRTPIPIVLADINDQANGAASFLPYPFITVFPVLPSPLESISSYENWAYEIMLHELTHLFSFTPSHGFYTPLRYVFGEVVAPNAITPRWVLEGLAVENESRYTTHGRLRSTEVGAGLRALVQEDVLKLETIDRINEINIPSWPFGERPYLFGSLLWHRLVEKTDNEIGPRLTQRYARRLPFSLNTPALELTGQDWVGHWRELREEIARDQTAQIDLIKKSGEMKVSAFPSDGPSQIFSASVSPDGRWLAYLSALPEVGTSIFGVERPPGSSTSFSSLPSRTLTYTRNSTKISWLPDSGSFIFDSITLNNRYNRFRDLFLLHLGEKIRVERLTVGARASQPAVSPDGREVAFIRSQGGRTDIMSLDLTTRKTRLLLRPTLGLRVSQPEFLDARTLVFLGRDKRGIERVYRQDQSGKRKVWFSGFQPVTTLQRTPKGLLLTSTRSGTANLYLVSGAGREPQAVTNTVTSTLNGSVDPKTNELIFSQRTGRGLKLFSSPLKFQTPAQVGPASVAKFAHPAPPPLQLRSVVTTESEYSPWKYLIPRYWIPFIYPVEGGVLFQGTTSVMDPSGHHAYDLLGTYDTVTRLGGYGFSYVNSATPVDFNVIAAESNEVLTGNQDRLTNRLLSLGEASFIPGLSNAWRGGLAWQFLRTQVPVSDTTVTYDRQGPTAQFGYQSSAGDLAGSRWGEADAILLHTRYLGGGDRLAYERSALHTGFTLNEPFPARHTLSLQAKGVTEPHLPLANVVALGDRTIGGNYLVTLINSNYLLRGYPSAALVGRNLVNFNLDYNFPVTEIHHGSGLFPWFSRALTMSVFFDASAVDGYFYRPADDIYTRTRLDHFFTGTGMEFNLSSTAAYHLPLRLTLGLYYGFDRQAGGGFIPFLGLGYVAHESISQEPATTTRFRPVSLAR